QDLRSRPLPMSQRRALWQEQQKKVPVVSKGESWRRKNAKLLREGKEALKEILYFFSPWRKALQLIGGESWTRSAGQSSFLPFRHALIAGFVLVPSIVFRGSEGTGFPNLTGNTRAQDPVLLECMNYNPNPQGLVPFYTYILDVLLGTGFVELSYLFYGFYENTVVEDRNFYNIPLAYLLTAAFYFAFCLICIVVRSVWLGYAARVAVATGGQTGGEYSMIAFAGWDYGSLGDKETKLKQKNILYRLQVDLEEERLKNQAAALTLKQKVFLYSLRVLLLFLALGLIAAALFGIFQATQFSQKMSGREGIVGLLIQYLPSIVITAGNFVVPLLCDQIALLERYSPSVTIILALMRAVVLRLVGLGVLLFTLWTQVTCGGNPEEDDCRLCQYNYKLYQCWETRVGQEMYKLTVFDLLIAVATLVLVEFPRSRMVVDHSSNALVQKLGRQEFVIPSNVLVLVYGQTVVWTGALFCPLLPLINTVKFIILFYCKKITLFHNCRPALRTFRSTTSTFFFLVVLLFGWGLATTVMVYSVTAIHPSMSCGPFRFFDNMWLIVPATLYSLSDTSRDFLFFIGSQAFSIPLFILLCVVLCYFIALASVYGKTVRLLRTQLKLEGRDKQFLVKQIDALSKHLQIPTHRE
uniref:Transmembrane channel-like protein n=1 Tax=Tetraodon nigroviridis TaxID=99883 RepID=H3DP10_TETNG